MVLAQEMGLNVERRKVPYEESLKVYQTIEQVYKDINMLRNEGL